ncbi:MAG: hypothetical protein ACKVW3_13000 [Phycisphaerales bacterium]
MPPIGTVQVDFVANIGRFAKDVKDATAKTATFAVEVGRLAGKSFAALHASASKVTSALTSVKAVMTGAVVAFGAAKFVGGLDAAADTVDKIGKAAKRLGVSSEQLSALRFAAGESGIEFERLATMASKAAKGVAELVDKGASSVKLGRLTVQLTDAAGQVRNVAELLPDLARGIESAGSEAEQLRLSQKFFGKGGGDDFVTLLKESGTFVRGLAEQTERARRLGVIFSEDQVTKLTAYRDAVGRVHQAWLGVKVAIMTEVAPALTRVLDDMAIRTASIPKVIGAVRNAMGVAAGSGEDARQAGELLHSVGSSVANLLIVSAREAGSLFAVTVTEGIRQVGTNIAIELGRGLRDLLPDWMLNDTWFSPGDPQVGSETKLRNLIKVRKELAGLNEEVSRLQDELDNNPRLDGQDKFQVEAQLNSAMAALKRLSSTDLVAIDKQIQAAQRELELNTSQLAQQRSQSAAESARRIRDAFVGGQSEIAKALAESSRTMAALAGQYATPEFYGPPAPLPGRVPDPSAMFKRLVEEAQIAGQRIGENLSKGWEQVKKGAEKASEQIKTLFEQAQQYRFELYPEEKVDADVEKLRTVTAAARRLKWEIQLTDDEIEKLAAKWREETKKKDKEVSNLAIDMTKAIQGFSESAGQAFADWVFDAQGSLGDLLKSWGKTLVAMATQALIFKPLFDSIGASFATSGVGQAAATVPTGTTGRADGGPVSGGSWSWVGERGPELVQFGRSGYVYPNGVMPSAGGGVTVNVYNESGATAQTSSRRGPDGRKIIDVMIRDTVKQMFSDGSLDRSMSQNYGSGRRGTSR